MTIWRAGMLAVCVDDTPCLSCEARRLVAGSVWLVSNVEVRLFLKGGETGLVLAGFATCCGSRFVRASRFRPAVQDDQRCEEEFISLLKRSKPTRIPAPTSDARPTTDAAGVTAVLSHKHGDPTPFRSQTRDDALGGNSDSNHLRPLYFGDI